MIRPIVILTINDLALAFRNKTLHLLIFIPLFIYASLTVVDKPGTSGAVARLGLIRGAVYADGVAASIEAAPQLITATWFTNVTEAKRQLAVKAVDGILMPAPGTTANAAVLLVAKRESLKTLAISESLAELQRAFEARGHASWVSEVSALTESRGLQNETLPVWILLLVLLVGFLVLPPQVAEEKEKKLLLAVLQTPTREIEWLAAKVLMGMTLTLVSIGLLQLVSRLGVAHLPGYLLLLAAGSFCFSSLGVLVGFLCRSPASARALGVVLYMPHLLPSALGEFSASLQRIAIFIPSYQFFTPLKAMLLDDAAAGPWSGQILVLIFSGLLSCGGALVLMKRRYLM